MKEAAGRAAMEAMGRERARCLWVCDAVVEDLERALKSKLLTPAQLQVTELRMRIVRSFSFSVRRAIVSGLSPKTGLRPVLDDAHPEAGQQPDSSAPSGSPAIGPDGDFSKE